MHTLVPIHLNRHLFDSFYNLRLEVIILKYKFMLLYTDFFRFLSFEFHVFPSESYTQTFSINILPSM